MNTPLRFFFLLAGIQAGLTTVAIAGQYSIDWHTIDGGGGISSGGAFTITGTIGQLDASGPMGGRNYSHTGGFWALPIAAPTPGTPVLHVVHGAPGFATISWDPATPGFVLEQSDSLTTSNWSDAPSGAANPTTVPVSLSAKFYRLRKP